MGKAAVLVAGLQQLAPGGVEAFVVLCQHGPVALPHLCAGSVTYSSCRVMVTGWLTYRSQPWLGTSATAAVAVQAWHVPGHTKFA